MAVICTDSVQSQMCASDMIWYVLIFYFSLSLSLLLYMYIIVIKQNWKRSFRYLKGLLILSLIVY